MKFAFPFAAALILASPALPAAAAEHACAAHARERGAELLAFHAGNDERIEIDADVKQVPGIENPANPRQRFDVLEVWGFVYKGQYRMRFLYAQLNGCVLMGEEVLQHASL
ncbi:hypothetical protein FOZ76_11735 [Verticiella sediminum]|uniref:Uncharacterized protein n=2 Tax=Verticiella sediminum TaxID=1247510 RepID=A0A556API9_9BURK|nr:hypothetical protein FOZ76_11735 [Verticiella sediminum]